MKFYGKAVGLSKLWKSKDLKMLDFGHVEILDVFKLLKF